jgi:hypothetical protein
MCFKFIYNFCLKHFSLVDRDMIKMLIYVNVNYLLFLKGLNKA